MALSNQIGQDLLNVPMGDMIREMAFAIAEAQVKLDENSIEVAEMMGGLKTIRDETTGEITFEDSRVFFGRETVTLGAAALLYNTIDGTTGDTELRNQVKNAIDNKTGDVTYESGSDTYTIGENADDVSVSIPVRLSMLELGFTPTFYQFVDTIIEVRLSISMSREVSYERSTTTNSTATRFTPLSGIRSIFSRKKNKSRAHRTVSTSQVNATYASKYNYSAEGSSLLRTKLAPVPPPSILEERIRLLLEDEQTKVSEQTAE